MLTLVHNLIEELNRSGIRYCHWKSNIALTEALEGKTDIDLLVHRADASAFRLIVDRLDFRPALLTDGDSFPSMEHYYGLDEESSVLVHVHAYYRVITGESLAKNYRLPIEQMLLENTRQEGSVPVPQKSAELLVFTVRMMLKHTSPMEIFLLSRYWKQVKKESDWLLEPGAREDALGLVKCWLPSVDVKLFAECISALEAPAPLSHRIRLGHKLRAQLHPYSRHSMLRAWIGELEKFAIMARRRLIRGPRGMIPRNGGAVIAFVGSEATGKTTLLAEMNHWLGEHFAVEQIHVGKPKSTLLTVIPNSFVSILRARFPTYRSTRIQEDLGKPVEENTRKSYPLVFAIRSTLLAHDRRAMLMRAYSRAANGVIVLCDRYPSQQIGAPDSPQLAAQSSPEEQKFSRRRLAEKEAQYYREMPPADLVVYLTAPLEVTVKRNATRGKREPEDYVRWRHARSANLEFGKTPVYRIDTDQPLEQTIRDVKHAIWNAL